MLFLCLSLRQLSHDVPATCDSPELRTLAKEKNISTHQLMLAWVLRHGDVLTIPRSGEASHMAENIAAADVTFSPDELTLFEQAFPAPRHHIPLEMI